MNTEISRMPDSPEEGENKPPELPGGIKKKFEEHFDKFIKGVADNEEIDNMPPQGTDSNDSNEQES